MVPELRAERIAREIRPHLAELGHANKATELSDFSVCTSWGIKGKDLYLQHVLCKRMEYPELQRAVREQCQAFEAKVWLIADKAFGTQLIQELIEHGLHPVTRYQPQSDKIMRSRRCQRLRLSRQAKLRFAESMHAQTAMIENDFVHLPKEAAWLVEYLHELPVFPKGKHDDQVDSTAQIGSEAGEVMAAVQTAMLAKLPYTVLRDAVIAHLTIAEGLGPLRANVPPRGRQ